MSDQQLSIQMSRGKRMTRTDAASTADVVYENEVPDPRKIGNRLWLIFRGLYNGNTSTRRRGICEFYLSRVKEPKTISDYVVAETLIIVCKFGDLSQGAGQPEEIAYATGIAYSHECSVKAGEKFVFTAEAKNPDIGKQEFKF